MATAAQRWRHSLADWAIPEEILSSAPESPWIHPPELFGVPDVIEPSPSHDRARDALPVGGSVLDVGCGGGVAAFALTPPAGHVVGVDQQARMLEMFRAAAASRGVTCATIEGSWPDVAGDTPVTDVVTCHHVAYNVGDIVPFLRALNDHARRRVVLELPDRHPLTSMNEAWRHFWRLERPAGPTPDDLVDVLNEMGIAAHRERWFAPARTPIDPELSARFLRIRLCLPASREREVYDFVTTAPPPQGREVSTVWWDASSRTQM